MATKAQRERAKRDVMTAALAAARKAIETTYPHVKKVPLDTTEGYLRIGAGFKPVDEAGHVDYVMMQTIFKETQEAWENKEFADDEMVDLTRKVLTKKGDGFFTRPDRHLDY